MSAEPESSPKWPRPKWTDIAMVVIALISIAVTLGILPTHRGSSMPPSGTELPTDAPTNAEAAGQPRMAAPATNAPTSGPTSGPQSWDSVDTDRTPFTEDALLSQRFTDDKGIEFARVAGGAKPCDQAASGDGPLVASDVIKELIGRGCIQVMTGVYLEQPGPNATPDNPVLVSIQVFPFPDTATANDVYNYLNGGARWNLSTWCTPTGVGTKPCIPGIDHGLRVESNRVDHRYVIAAVSNRTDLSNASTIGPWLDSASNQAANSSGPENYRGH